MLYILCGWGWSGSIAGPWEVNPTARMMFMRLVPLKKTTKLFKSDSPYFLKKLTYSPFFYSIILKVIWNVWDGEGDNDKYSSRDLKCRLIAELEFEGMSRIRKRWVIWLLLDAWISWHALKYSLNTSYNSQYT